MRTHLGCSGQVKLGKLSPDTQQKLERIEATWLEFVPESVSLEVRHVQPDDRPVLPEIVREMVEFLSQVTDEERAQVGGGTVYYQDGVKGQYVRVKVGEGGFLTVAWARPDYTRASWEQYRSQPVSVVPEPTPPGTPRHPPLSGRFRIFRGKEPPS